MIAAGNRRNLPDAAGGSERGHGFRAVGVMASKLARPIASKRGGVVARLKADWVEIVGPHWAAVAWPAALARDGALKLRVAPVAVVPSQQQCRVGGAARGCGR